MSDVLVRPVIGDTVDQLSAEESAQASQDAVQQAGRADGAAAGTSTVRKTTSTTKLASQQHAGCPISSSSSTPILAMYVAGGATNHCSSGVISRKLRKTAAVRCWVGVKATQALCGQGVCRMPKYIHACTPNTMPHSCLKNDGVVKQSLAVARYSWRQHGQQRGNIEARDRRRKEDDNLKYCCKFSHNRSR